MKRKIFQEYSAIENSQSKRKLFGKAAGRNSGFTMVEMVVATTIFTMVVAGMTTLMNYTLKINRRAEALRQATQGMRNFMEFLVKEVRNGRIDYSVEQGLVQSYVHPCPKPEHSLGAAPAEGSNTTGADTYYRRENRLGIINLNGSQSISGLVLDLVNIFLSYSLRGVKRRLGFEQVT